MPTGEYDPEWQNCMSWHDPLIASGYGVLVDFQMTERLPNVTWSLARNWAGNIHMQRVRHPNDTLFFSVFESSNDSFTANSGEP